MRLRSTILIATFVIYGLFVTDSSGYRILGIFLFPAQSHYFLGSSLLKGLAEAGHDVTMISPFSLKSLPENGTWNEIVVKDIRTTYESNSNIMNFSKLTVIQQWIKHLELINYISQTTLNNPEVQNLIHSHEKFDAVIVNEIFMDAMKAFAAHFKAHLISFSPFVGYNFYYSALDIPSLPSHFPELHLNNINRDKLSYFDRITNVWLWVIRTSLTSWFEFPQQADLVKKHFPNVPGLEDIIRNTSLVLVNAHSSTSYQHPKISIMVDIGGFHLKPPKKLPQNLQTILDKAKYGIIYFSMGSNLKPEHLPKNKIEVFLKVFAERKELVLWKCTENIVPGKSDNVILGDWFPQQDILAHPNMKLFITHGGFLSLTETIYNGVPTISIPLAFDQTQNAIFLAANGLGLTVNLEDLTEETLSYSIEEVISNPKYSKVSKERSVIHRDRMKPPMEEAIYWVEYVLRHNGAKHLKTTYLGLPWYQFYLLDVIGTFMIGIIFVIWLTKKTVLFIFGMFKKFEKLKTI